MKRYALFGGDRYYPEGGWYDLKGTFATLDEAVEAGPTCMLDKFYAASDPWWHVVDLHIGEMVHKDRRSVEIDEE